MHKAKVTITYINGETVDIEMYVTEVYTEQMHNSFYNLPGPNRIILKGEVIQCPENIREPNKALVGGPEIHPSDCKCGPCNNVFK